MNVEMIWLSFAEPSIIMFYGGIMFKTASTWVTLWPLLLILLDLILYEILRPVYIEENPPFFFNFYFHVTCSFILYY